MSTREVGAPPNRSASATDVTDDDMAKERSPYASDLEDLHLEVLRDMRSQRQKVLRWATVTTSVLLIFTGILVGWHMVATQGHLDDKVLMAWIASVLAASIGIIASISKYLFAETSKAMQPLNRLQD